MQVYLPKLAVVCCIQKDHASWENGTHLLLFNEVLEQLGTHFPCP